MYKIFLLMCFFVNIAVNAAEEALLEGLPLKENHFTILFVEDNRVVQTGFKFAVQRLKQQNYQIEYVKAEDKDDAISCYKEEQTPHGFDLVLMDLSMPGDTQDLKGGTIYGGLLAAQVIRELGYKGPMLAITSCTEGEIAKLRNDYPDLFREWRGKIKTAEDLEGILKSLTV